MDAKAVFAVGQVVEEKAADAIGGGGCLNGAVGGQQGDLRISHFGGRRIQDRAGESVGGRCGLLRLGEERGGENGKDEEQEKRTIRGTLLSCRIGSYTFHFGPWAKSAQRNKRTHAERKVTRPLLH